MSLMLELVSMVRPFGHWHFLLAICLLDLALIAVHVTNRQDTGAADLQERLVEVRKALAEQEEMAQQLVGRVQELKSVREERKKGLEVLAEGVSDLEARVWRLGKFLDDRHDNVEDGHL